jgi:protocatechuate 3,4-dioxygenase beta subunit
VHSMMPKNHDGALQRPDAEDHHHGLAQDLARWQQQLASRRHALRWLGTAGAVGASASLGGLAAAGLYGCGGGGDATGTTTGSTSGTTGTTGGSTSSGSCSIINAETQGPYPGDGTNSNGSGIANALSLSGIVRSDITSSLGGASGVAGGVPLTLDLTLVNANASCATLQGYAIYLWHCDALGRYSMYSSGVTAENYLRGVQASDASGKARFVTVFPGCYDGRVPHMHFEIYASLGAATVGSNAVRTSQLAFPTDVCQAVYATSGYGSSASNLSRTSLATDGIFRDGYAAQMVSISGDTTSGYSATLQIGIGV